MKYCPICCTNRILFYQCYSCEQEWCHKCHRKMDHLALQKQELLTCPYCRACFFRHLKMCRVIRRIHFVES